MQWNWWDATAGPASTAATGNEQEPLGGPPPRGAESTGNIRRQYPPAISAGDRGGTALTVPLRICLVPCPDPRDVADADERADPQRGYGHSDQARCCLVNAMSGSAEWRYAALQIARSNAFCTALQSGGRPCSSRSKLADQSLAVCKVAGMLSAQGGMGGRPGTHRARTPESKCNGVGRVPQVRAGCACPGHVRHQHAKRTRQQRSEGP
jgi:hypothetical protein